MDYQNTLHFGVEIELLVQERKKNQDWDSLARDVSRALARRAGLSNHVGRGASGKGRETYHEWVIMQEVTIQSKDGFMGIELVSPIYACQPQPGGGTSPWAWPSDLSAIFAALSQDRFVLRVSPQCSTHVHVSRSPVPLSPAELASLAHAALHYEAALDAVVPEARRGGSSSNSSGHWCQSPRASHALAHLPSLGACHAAVDAAVAGGARGVAEVVNLVARESRYGRARGMTRDSVRGKLFKWNLAGMVPGISGGHHGGEGLGTVEFRQPPGSLCGRDAVVWVTLALAFVAGAVAGGGNGGGSVYYDAMGDAEEGASVGELWEFLMGGARALGWSDLGDVSLLFAGGLA